MSDPINHGVLFPITSNSPFEGNKIGELVKTFEKTLLYWYEKRNDPILVPRDHYFHTFLSLTACKLYQRKIANWMLTEYFNINSTISLEFNKYALTIIYSEHAGQIDPLLMAKIERTICDNRYSAGFNTWTGNNWLFLRALIHLRLYICLRRESDWHQFCQFFDHIIKLGVQGLFCDFPPKRKWEECHQRAFPFTYSFKMLASLIEMHSLLERLGLDVGRSQCAREIIEQSIYTHLNLIAPDGESLYFGRSDSTLFGYGNVLYCLLSIVEGCSTLKEHIDAVQSYVFKQFVREGVIVRSTAYDGYKDDYIYDGVYVAYFMARVLQVLDKKPFITMAMDTTREKTTVMENPAGFVIKGQSFFYFLSSSGCHITQNRPDFCGYRYSGLTFMKSSGIAEPISYGLLQIYRERIGSPEVDIPFVPRIRFCVFDIVAFTFANVKAKENNESFFVTGMGEAHAMVRYRVLKRILGRISGFGIVGKVLELFALKYEPKVVRLFMNLERTVMIDKQSGRIHIVDRSQRRKYLYILPKHWTIMCQSSHMVEENEDSIVVEASGKIIEIFSPSE